MLTGVAVVLLVLLLASALMRHWANSVPDWYTQTLTPAERAAAAARAENLWAEAQARIAQAYSVELEQNATQRLASDGNGIAISFSGDELNAFYNKWAEFQGWDRKLDAYVENPQIVLLGGRLILAGKMKMLDGRIVSVHFEPRIDEQGQLRLRLTRVLAGELPLPQAVWHSQRERLLASIRRHLPRMQQGAKLAANGNANSDAISAAMGRLLLQILHDQPGEPVIFAPLLTTSGRQYMPVRLTNVTIAAPQPGEPERLTLVVEPMSPAEREDFLHRLRQPQETDDE